jgi:3-oxoacyl-[acyl-carrier-protein] synthase-3
VAISRFVNTRIAGVVTAVPGEPIAVTSLPVSFPAADISKIAKSVGLVSLHRAAVGQTASDLSLEASRSLLAKLAWEPETIDALVNVTQTPDAFSPATACILHGKLGLSSACLAFDVNIACSGYIYGLLLAWQFVTSGTARRVLLTVSDTLGKTVSPGDRSTSVLFGDAGSATGIEFHEGAPAAVFVTGTDGTGADDLCIPAGGWRWPLDDKAVTPAEDESGNVREPRHIYMDGLSIFNFTLARVPEMTRLVVAESGWSLDQVNRFYFHQANGFILKTLANKMSIPLAKVPLNIGKFGNTSMASIPLLLTDPELGCLSRTDSDRVLMAGFGAGFSWAAFAGSIADIRVAHHMQTGHGSV